MHTITLVHVFKKNGEIIHRYVVVPSWRTINTNET
jgi:hypothetical protein